MTSNSNTPPADDVREALGDAIHNAMNTKFDIGFISDAILAAFEVRPRGTVADLDAPDPESLRWAADFISRTEPTYGNAAAFVTPYIPGAANALRDYAEAVEAARNA